MAEEMELLYSTLCEACGIVFGFKTEVKELWKESGKTFYCPNGHGLSWPKPKSKPEIEELKDQVKDLTKKLEAANKDIEMHKKQITELKAELEIWRPRTSEGNKE